jgi:hypothetical protein
MKKFLNATLLCVMAVCTLASTSCDEKNPPEPNQKYSITISNDGNGTARASLEEAEHGTVVTLSATPNDDYVFSKWTVVRGSVELNDHTVHSAEFAMPNHNIELKAEFVLDPDKYNIVVTNDGNGTGTASPQRAKAGETVTLEATPDDGYVFSKWSVTSGNVTFEDPGANPATFTMPDQEEDVVINAEFVAMKYTVTLTVEGNGTATATAERTETENGAVTAVEGELVFLVATPENGHGFVKWTVIGGDVELADEIDDRTTFYMGKENVEIKAEFRVWTPPFPDPVFAQYCLRFDTDGNGVLSQEEMDAVTRIDLSNWGEEPAGLVQSLEGIEVFKNLEYLNCSSNNITEIDLSGNVKLTYLDCSRNTRLEVLNISANTALIELHCVACSDIVDSQPVGLQIFDVTNNTALQILECGSNHFTTLNLTNNIELTSLSLGSGKVTSLDLSKNTKLNTIALRNTQALTALDLTGLAELKKLDIYRTKLPTVTLGGNTNLNNIDCEAANGLTRQGLVSMFEGLPMRDSSAKGTISLWDVDAAEDLTSNDEKIATDKNWELEY